MDVDALAEADVEDVSASGTAESDGSYTTTLSVSGSAVAAITIKKVVSESGYVEHSS